MGPLPWTRIMPTGGVEPTKEDIARWMKAGAVCLGMGSNLISKDFISAENYDGIRDKVATVLQFVREARSEHEIVKEVTVKELVELIAKALVDQPDRVLVSQLEGEQTTILELKVAPEDLGKVIGKQGRTARAIRIILGAAGMKLKRRFNLEIIEKG